MPHRLAAVLHHHGVTDVWLTHEYHDVLGNLVGTNGDSSLIAEFTRVDGISPRCAIPAMTTSQARDDEKPGTTKPGRSLNGSLSYLPSTCTVLAVGPSSPCTSAKRTISPPSSLSKS